MQNFTKRILVLQGFNPEFFFNRIYTVKGTIYHVSVLDKKRHTYIFNMEQRDSKWKIINAAKFPGWIMNVEHELENAIFGSLTR